MDEQQESAFILKPGKHLFGHLPLELFLYNLVIGVGLTIFYPLIVQDIEDRFNPEKVVILLSFLAMLGGASIGRILFYSIKTAIGVRIHFALGSIVFASGLAAIGVADKIFEKNILLALFIGGRAIQGVGAGYSVSLSSAVTSEDPRNECKTKMFLQLSIILGMMGGLVLACLWDNFMLLFLTIAGASIITMILIQLGLKGNQLTDFKIEEYMKINLKNIAFRNRGTTVLLVVFIANTVPPLLDYSIPKIITILCPNRFVGASIYITLSFPFLLVILMKRWIFEVLGTRLPIILGLGLMATGVYLVLPIYFIQPSQLYLANGTALVGFGLGLVNVFSALDLIALGSNFYRVSIKHIRNTILHLYSIVAIISVVSGYTTAIFLFEYKGTPQNKQKEFGELLYLGETALIALTCLLYILSEGIAAIKYIGERNKRKSESVMQIVDEAATTKMTPNGNVISDDSVEFQRERYINANLLLGRYFTGDCLGVDSPYLI